MALDLWGVDLWGVVVEMVVEVVGAVEVVTVKADAVDVGAVSRDDGEAVGEDVSTGACTLSVSRCRSSHGHRGRRGHHRRHCDRGCQQCVR